MLYINIYIQHILVLNQVCNVYKRTNTSRHIRTEIGNRWYCEFLYPYIANTSPLQTNKQQKPNNNYNNNTVASIITFLKIQVSKERILYYILYGEQQIDRTESDTQNVQNIFAIVSNHAPCRRLMCACMSVPFACIRSHLAASAHLRRRMRNEKMRTHIHTYTHSVARDMDFTNDYKITD